MRRGFEFWLGSGFVFVAMIAITPAFFISSWRSIIGEIGPATAAFAVVGAALIAYDGAVAKVRFDLTESRTRERNRKIRTLLMLYLGCYELSIQCRRFSERMEKNPAVNPDGSWIDPLSEPQAFEDAWQNIDTIPVDIITSLFDIRAELIRVNQIHSGLFGKTVDIKRRRSLAADANARIAKGIAEQTDDISRKLWAEIHKVIPKSVWNKESGWRKRLLTRIETFVRGA